MSERDNGDLREQVDKAIEKVLVGGQSYKIGSRSLARAELSELRKMRAELEAEVGGDGGALDNVHVALFDRR
jgi:hypothetical protein